MLTLVFSHARSLFYPILILSIKNVASTHQSFKAKQSKPSLLRSSWLKPRQHQEYSQYQSFSRKSYLIFPRLVFYPQFHLFAEVGGSPLPPHLLKELNGFDLRYIMGRRHGQIFWKNNLVSFLISIWYRIVRYLTQPHSTLYLGSKISTLL